MFTDPGKNKTSGLWIWVRGMEAGMEPSIVLCNPAYWTAVSANRRPSLRGWAWTACQHSTAVGTVVFLLLTCFLFTTQEVVTALPLHTSLRLRDLLATQMLESSCSDFWPHHFHFLLYLFNVCVGGYMCHGCMQRSWEQLLGAGSSDPKDWTVRVGKHLTCWAFS